MIIKGRILNFALVGMGLASICFPHNPEANRDPDGRKAHPYWFCN
jgi:hypothetical protein